MKFNQELYADIMEHIMQTEVWEQIEKNNPMIDTSSRRLHALLNNLRGQLSDEIVETIFNDIFNYVTATAESAVLYGIQVANALNEIIANPAAYSQNVLQKNAKIQHYQSRPALQGGFCWFYYFLCRRLLRFSLKKINQFRQVKISPNVKTQLLS